MVLNRRDFLAAGTSGLALTVLPNGPARASGPSGVSPDAMGVLVDIPNCIGCRKCEFACQQAAGFDVPPIETYDDKSVFEQHRRPHPRSYTTVNRFDNPLDAANPVFVKANCLHCNDPACVSACIVGAFTKQESGAVTYEPWKCMGCRYCMVACPFQIPTYDYDNPLTPQVRKCTFCFEQLSKDGGLPACVKICPRECLTYGKRSELLGLAHERIGEQPEKYVDRVYGEHEAGGTSWMYLSSVPFEQLGFLSVGNQAPPRLTETIQHGVFKKFMPPLALYGVLGLIMWLAKPERRGRHERLDVEAGHVAAAGNGRSGQPTPREPGESMPKSLPALEEVST